MFTPHGRYIVLSELEPRSVRFQMVLLQRLQGQGAVLAYRVCIVRLEGIYKAGVGVKWSKARTDAQPFSDPFGGHCLQLSTLLAPGIPEAGDWLSLINCCWTELTG